MPDEILKISRATLTESGVPSHIHNGFVLWFQDGIQPGGFLSSVLQGDHVTAALRADPKNKEALPCIVQWLHRFAPREGHGSLEACQAWAARHNSRWVRA